MPPRSVSTAGAAAAAAVAATLLLAARPAGAANPLVPNVGQADPHVHVWDDGRFWMYATHDFSDNNTGFLMKDWWVWSSPDLVAWTRESVLNPADTPASKSEWDECWATDGAFANGAYYFYLSMGPTSIGVVRSNATPGGPWENVLGVPLVNTSVGPGLNPPTQSRDPCAFRDADGSHYLIFGTFQYYIARLGDDLMSFAEPLRHVTIINATGPYGPNSTDDKPFLALINGVYYLSWGAFYATGSSPYGPFTFRGAFFDSAAISPPFRMNNSGSAWYANEDLSDRHGSFFTAHGQWYFAANDRSHSPDKKYPHYFRDVVAGYVHIRGDGSIAPIVIDATGVGQYDAAAGVEAENFFELAPADAPGGPAKWEHPVSRAFGVRGLAAGSRLRYPRVGGVVAGSVLTVAGYNGGAGPAAVTVTAYAVATSGSARAAPLGSCVALLPAHPAGDWDALVEAPCVWAPQAAASAGASALRGGSSSGAGVAGVPAWLPSDVDLVLTFASGGSAPGATAKAATAAAWELVRLDRLHFVAAAAAAASA
jgi:arabinoxylan arabinofuranohydrolase